MTTTDSTVSGANVPPVSLPPPAESETSPTFAPTLASAPPVPPAPPAPPEVNPLDCPHIRTGLEQVALRPAGQPVEHAVTQAADWVSRNAPNLYTLAQALQLFKMLFRGHG